MNIQEVITYTGVFFRVLVENGQVRDASLVAKVPHSAEGFARVEADLRELRRVIWPEYSDAATQSVTLDLNKYPPIHKGKVKWFNDAKGFGFLEEDETKREIFVHYTEIQSNEFRSLAEGDQVSFEIKEGPKGLTAANVRKI